MNFIIKNEVILKYLIRFSFIFRPTYWVRNYRCSEEWDKELNSMLDKPVFEYTGSHTIKLNGKMVWISNYPYAYGSPYEWGVEVLPRRETVIRLKDTLDKFYFNRK